MNPIEKLKSEHRDIEVGLRLLTSVAKKLEHDSNFLSSIEQLVVFLQQYADIYHHGKEEKLLFTTMEEAGFPNKNGPIGVMLMEHEQGRGYVRGLIQAIDEFKQGNAGAIGQIKENAANYRSLLEQHINKEDNILYVMADTHLNSDLKHKLTAAFEQFEQANSSAGIRLREELYSLKSQM